MVVVFTGTVAHKMVMTASQQAEKTGAYLRHCHSSSGNALNEVLKEMEQTNKEIEQAEGEFLSLLKELTSSDEKIMASLNELVKKMER